MSRYQINLLDRKDQLMLGKAHDDRFTLGMDAEILPQLKTGKLLWPHICKAPQVRGSAKWAGEKHDWHGDGYAFEVCIEPTTCIDRVLEYTAKAFTFMSRRYGAGMKIMAPTIYQVPGRVRASAPAEVRRLGCMPSFNVYDDPGVPESLDEHERTTGCHLHISHPWLNNKTAKVCVKWADVLVGNAWNYISPEPSEVEAQRRQAYGRAGEHRRNIYPDKSFGFEYRVLPGRVLGHPAYLSLMFNLLRSACQMAYRRGEPSALLASAARAAINKADKPLSKAILDTMPFTEKSRQLLDHLAKHPLEVLSMREWSNMGSQSHGHVVLFNNLKEV